MLLCGVDVAEKGSGEQGESSDITVMLLICLPRSLLATTYSSSKIAKIGKLHDADSYGF